MGTISKRTRQILRLVRTHKLRLRLSLLMLTWLYCLMVWGDGPQDNLPDQVRRIPKVGIEIPQAERDDLQQRLDRLKGMLQLLMQGDAQEVTNPEHARALLPDVEIFYRAVQQALYHQEFFDLKELATARRLLDMGMERAQALKEGHAPWTRQTGLIVRGYRSRIDHTVQPYGLVIPADVEWGSPQSLRCDIWLHGRSETLSEVNFLQQRLSQFGEYMPRGTIVLHPYGRFCNAFKFAGEIDVFEALEDVQQRYPEIDPQRVVVRGFSMGGAGCWQLAVHYPGRWLAANPGAGFAETPEFLRVFQQEQVQPTWWEQKLWRWYDCPGYAANLAFLPVVAYSGELDKQKQAADIMAEAMQREGLSLLHIVGPMTAHKIHPESKTQIERILSRWDRLGPPHALVPPYSAQAGWLTIDQFVTYTLRYPESRMIRLEGLEEHWEPARVVLDQWIGDASCDQCIHLRVRMNNVRKLILRGLPAAATRLCLLEVEEPGQRQTLRGVAQLVGREQGALGLVKGEEGWKIVAPGEVSQFKTGILEKRPGLQGPIDDAFLDSFIFVKPTGTGLSSEVDRWVQQEFERAVEHWRRQMRGEARVMLDSEISRRDMQQAHIVLWGDPISNEVLALLAPRLPITWMMSEKTLQLGELQVSAEHHLPTLIYPNPWNPERYVVLNSGFTYREYDYLNNARQTPKLPDWALVDVRVPPNSRSPGGIVQAGFFDEQWRLKPRMMP
ncbi:MAG: hypothetical protein KatS3mg113_0150 [Planctomycetaceae bacterium]|nr:MAG: hypothetical protein KatS3mg113_0150 [Planctomycetaceae bacterium]